MSAIRVVKPQPEPQTAPPPPAEFTPQQWAAIDARIARIAEERAKVIVARERAARKALVGKLYQALKLFVDWAESERNA